MTAIVWGDVTGWDSTLSTVPDGAQTIILSIVNGLFNVAEFGGEEHEDLRNVRILAAAHFGVLNKQGRMGRVGVITSQSGGGLSRSYAASPASSSIFGGTAHGLALISLLRPALRAPRVV